MNTADQEDAVNAIITAINGSDAMQVDGPGIAPSLVVAPESAGETIVIPPLDDPVPGPDSAFETPAVEPPRRVQRARFVVMNSRALTPMQKAVYEQTSDLISPLESREEVFAIVEGSSSEGWIKINGLTDHVFVKVRSGPGLPITGLFKGWDSRLSMIQRRLNREERRIALGE